jgi:UDP-glucose 4-epimerase
MILITGGLGFIGSHIAESLAKESHDIRVLDCLLIGKKDNLAGIKADIVKGDIRDPAAVKKSLKDVEYVFHQAAQVSIPRSVEDPVENNQINVDATLLLLDEARKSGVKKLLFASSSAVYGNVQDRDLPLKEDRILSPLSPYAVSKLVGEHYCRIFSSIYGLDTICLRYLNVYGPRQRPDSQYAAVIPKFIDCVLKGKAPTIFGDGKQTRDFIFVKDVARANLIAMKSKVKHGVYNVGTGKATSLLELLDSICSIAGKKTKPVFSDPKPGDIKHSVADISKIREIGFRPEYSMEQGLRETIKSFTS